MLEDRVFDQNERRPHILIPLPSCTAKGFPGEFYKSLSAHVFKTRPRYVIELAFFSPENDFAYEEMYALHRAEQGVYARLRLTEFSSECNHFVASLPRFVVLPVEPRFYRANEEHSIFKTFLLGNAVKELLREQNWQFREHPITRELKKRIQGIFLDYDQDEWKDAEYAKASEKLSRKVVVDLKEQIQFWMVDWKEFNASAIVDAACRVFQ